jgi:hypothetical protein
MTTSTVQANRGALPNLGHDLARSTIAQILQRHGIEPAPERKKKTTWKEFLGRHHWELIVATDFFTVEVWTRRGLQRFIILFFIDLSTRKVEIAGAPAANGLWMRQIARNLTDTEQRNPDRKTVPDSRSRPIVHR